LVGGGFGGVFWGGLKTPPPPNTTIGVITPVTAGHWL
jgi:hypothetical protein